MLSIRAARQCGLQVGCGAGASSLQRNAAGLPLKVDKRSRRLRLAGPDRHIEWVSGEGDTETVQSEKPEASGWLQPKARLLGNFVHEGWL